MIQWFAAGAGGEHGEIWENNKDYDVAVSFTALINQQMVKTFKALQEYYINFFQHQSCMPLSWKQKYQIKLIFYEEKILIWP